jgi:Uma2 family endonuclease
MLFLKDDTEDAPWMTLNDSQFWAASSLAHSLRSYGHQQGLPWYVASMLPIIFTYGHSSTKHQLAPDLLVALRPEHPRTSYDVKVEGSFPPFVLEVGSPASTKRDREDKYNAYQIMEVQEYVLFHPRRRGPSTLQGYRLGPDSLFEAWPLDEQGRLWSEVLKLYLVVRGRLIQAQTADGQWLLTPEELAEARLQAEAERIQAQAERIQAEADRIQAEADRIQAEADRVRLEDVAARETEARRHAEAEVERLRQVIERLSGGEKRE